MQTKVIHVDPERPEDTRLLPACAALRRGELVAFPTETVYGLGASAWDAAAVARIFAVKGRPPDNPLIVHLADQSGLSGLVRYIPPLAVTLLDAFAPGPLTLVLPRSDRVPDLVTAGLDTVAIRIPDHPVAHRILALCGLPLAAPSANRSGRPSPTRAWHVLEDLKGLIPYVIDGGPCMYGLESTVVDLSGPVPLLLRPGSISADDIRQVTGIDVSGGGMLAESNRNRTPRAPGMKYRHYAPRAILRIGTSGTGPDSLGYLVRQALASGQKTGLFACRRTLDTLPADLRIAELAPGGIVHPDLPDSERSGVGIRQDWPVSSAGCKLCLSISYAAEPDAAAAGRRLFDALRQFDQAGADIILAEGLDDHGPGAAYMNRLKKAARTDEDQDGEMPLPDRMPEKG